MSFREFEYLEHTADFKIRGIGSNLKRAFEAVALGVANLMYDYDKVEPKNKIEFVSEEPDIFMALYFFLSKILDVFYLENFAVGDIKIKNLRRNRKRKTWLIRFCFFGEKYDPDKHGRGKEVKAITFNDMKIDHISRGKWIVEVVVDV